jgi:hypothetical protein
MCVALDVGGVACSLGNRYGSMGSYRRRYVARSLVGDKRKLVTFHDFPTALSWCRVSDSVRVLSPS